MKIKKVLIAAVCVVAFTACTNEIEKADNSGRENEPGIDVIIPEPKTDQDCFYTLPKNPGNVTLPEAWNGKNVFLIYSNESNSNQYSKDDTIYNLVEDEDSNRSSAAGYKRTLNPKAVYMGDGFFRDEITFELPESLRNWRNEKNVTRAATNPSGGELNYYNPELGELEEGAKVNFWYAAGDESYFNNPNYTYTPEEGDINNNGEYIRKGTFTLKKVGEKCRIWVLDNNPDNTDIDFDNYDYAKIAKTIDDTYVKVTDIFGSNIVNGGTQAIKADENTKLEILVYDLFANAQYSENGGVLGFFRGLDFFQNKYIEYREKSSELSFSNECQLINIDSYFLKNWEGKTISTLIHEFQHLLNFCNKNEQYSTWFTEMLSMCSEDVFMNAIGLDEKSGPMSRLNDGYFGKTDQGFGNWGKNDNVFYSYANAYGFGAYLMRNYGGLQLIHEIATNSFIDKDAINAALINCGYNESFESVFQKFAITFIYTSEGCFYSLNREINETFNGNTYKLNAINLDEAHFYIGKFNGNSLEDKNNKATNWINNNLYIKNPDGEYTYYSWGDETTFSIKQPKIYLNSYKFTEAIQPYGFIVYYLGKAGKNQTYTIDKNSNLTMTLVVK